MRVLITDVTDMQPGKQCVAGWDIDNECMVRPLPDGDNWTTTAVDAYGISPGVVVEFEVAGRVHNGSYPHSTEDKDVLSNKVNVIGASGVDWTGADAPKTGDTVQGVFARSIKNSSEFRGVLKGVHVTTGTKCHSLGGIEIARRQLTLETDSFRGGPEKLRAILDDGENTYSLSVSSSALKAAFAQGGLPAANALLPKGNIFHVRLGLARAFQDSPDKCTLMLNGVHG